MGKWRGRGIYGGRDSRIYGERGRGSGRFSRGRGRGYSHKLVPKVTTLVNGKKIDYHTSIKFSDDIYQKIKNDQRETLHREIQEYQDKQGNNYGGGNKVSIE